MYSRLLCMIINPNKFLTISFFLAGRSQGLNAALMGGRVRWKAVVVAHSTGLHLAHQLHLRDIPLVSAKVLEAVSISQFPDPFRSS